MRKKRKIIIALLLAVGLFVNISDSNVSPSANSIDAFSERGPIGGDHWKILEFEKRLKEIILFISDKQNQYWTNVKKYMITRGDFLCWKNQRNIHLAF